MKKGHDMIMELVNAGKYSSTIIQTIFSIL